MEFVLIGGPVSQMTEAEALLEYCIDRSVEAGNNRNYLAVALLETVLQLRYSNVTSICAGHFVDGGTLMQKQFEG